MTVTLYDKSGSAPVAMGAATIPVGGNLGEGLLTLKVIGEDGLPVIGSDQQHSRIEIKVRCGQVAETGNLIPAGGHCGMGETGTPDVYDTDCATGYCAWVGPQLAWVEEINVDARVCMPVAWAGGYGTLSLARP